ncbi:helix-turn-helix domain-containing protein [Paracoccus sp. Z330]|uniref:Helix-turn-helix domain-containing protein n=1 Tax=Paracoccus onchidii TaxID=3017813 RepID=A0ABT4ZFG2_9RHOB|nr:helix-turn-helix domain-containing protein [Paracoccus onchidii]MDB6177698.1 helix-turn-helix domain-containing protein [Paracoccus onchidii]
MTILKALSGCSSSVFLLGDFLPPGDQLRYNTLATPLRQMLWPRQNARDRFHFGFALLSPRKMETIVGIFMQALYCLPYTNDRAHFGSLNMVSTVVSDPASLGRIIRQVRKASKITQEDLELQTGISRTTIRAIEQGKETAHIGLVLQLCRDLGMTLRIGAPTEESRS